MIREIRPGSGVPSFPTVADAREAMAKKDRFEPSPLYPRDGTTELAYLEARYGQLVDVPAGHLLLYTSGMAAVSEAIEAAPLTAGTVVAYGDQLYSQSARFLSQELSSRGIRMINLNSGSLRGIDNVIQRQHPQIIFLEAVTNTPEMSVLDVEGFLALSSLAEDNPLVIIDNTLPTPSALPLGDVLRTFPGRLLVVESGTKSYSLNAEMSGMIYTVNPELLARLRRRRRMVGNQLSSSAVATIGELLLPKEIFDQRNRLILKNTYRLAQTLEAAKQEGGEFTVSYPNLPTHPNYAYASRVFPDGAASVLFISPAAVTDPWVVVQQMWQNETIRMFCDLGQSFGFDRTRIWPDSQFPQFPSIRIAGGTERPEEIELLTHAFGKVVRQSFGS